MGAQRTAFHIFQLHPNQLRRRLRRQDTALHASDTDFTTFFELAAVGMAQAEPFTGRFLRINAAFRRLTGYSDHELRQMTFSDITLAADRGKDRETFDRMVRGEVPVYISEKRYVHRTGQVYWVQVVGNLVRDETGQPVHTAAIVVDVSAQHKAEARCRAITDNASVGLLMLDLCQRCTFLNPAAERIIGYSLSTLGGRPLHDLLVPAVDGFLGRGLSGPDHGCGMALFKRPDGGTHPVAYTASPALEEGRLVGTVLELRDVTEANRAAAELARSEQRFADLVENLPEIAWTAQANGTIDFYNRRWFAFTGSTPEAMLGWGWRLVHQPDMLAAVETRWQTSIASGQEFEMEFPLRRHDGVYCWFLTRVSPLQDEDGRVVRWVGINIDIDDLRRSRAERERLVNELQQALLIRDDFLAIASHELRTPLTALRLDLQSAMRRAGRGDGLGLITAKVARANLHTERLNRLMDGILDVSRITEGELPLNCSDVDLGDLVRRVLARHQGQVQASGCSVQLQLIDLAIGSWDRLRLDQVVYNLLTNALKYGAGKPIQVHMERLAHSVVLTVRDQGMGVAADDLERIFGCYERAVPKRHYGGLGLGLFIARQIVRAHGGDIVAISALGEGASFSVHLPCPPACAEVDLV